MPHCGGRGRWLHCTCGAEILDPWNGCPASLASGGLVSKLPENLQAGGHGQSRPFKGGRLIGASQGGATHGCGAWPAQQNLSEGPGGTSVQGVGVTGTSPETLPLSHGDELQVPSRSIFEKPTKLSPRGPFRVTHRLDSVSAKHALSGKTALFPDNPSLGAPHWLAGPEISRGRGRYTHTQPSLHCQPPREVRLQPGGRSYGDSTITHFYF